MNKLEYGMTVGQLKRRLEGIPDDTAVILSTDGEGNSYSPLSGLYTGDVYVPESPWGGDVRMTELTEEDRSVGYSPEDVYYGDDGVDCVVLKPIN